MTNTAIDITVSHLSSQDPSSLLAKEWLVTNGIGGYASGSLLGLATRRYHGLFVPELPGWGRTMLVPRLDDTVKWDGGQVLLSGAEYADGRIEAEGHRCLAEFRREGQTPLWRFQFDQSLLEKRIVTPQGRNTTHIEYRLTDGPPLRLQLRPFLTCRKHDADLALAHRGPFTVRITDGRYETSLPDALPSLKYLLRPRCGVFVGEPVVSAGVSYRVDRERGSPSVEDLFSPGYFAIALSTGARVGFTLSVESWEQIECDGGDYLEQERRRVTSVTALKPDLQQDPFTAHLQIAADQFLAAPGARPKEKDEAKTIMAGYHWFGDWGRDAMISLEGLTLCTGRHRDANAILRTFARHVRDGLIPNLFPEGASAGLYHTVDATLWLYHALDRYLTVTGDRDILADLYPVLQDVLQRHRQGTRFNIRVDDRDGLLQSGAPGVQLTWMDAKVGDWIVTPRRGKPVEIQALWYNALRVMVDWSRELRKESARWVELAEQAEESFHRRYWYGAGGYLYDVVDGEAGDDSSLRPNQILALSLRYPILRRDRWQAIVDVVRDRLLTPFGLRTLAPDHPDYKRTYSGDLRARDAAYHQGTVWPWLIGPYVDAYLRAYGDRGEARRLLDAFHGHLQEAGIGTISEIFDAEPPYPPRGCIAQAWSVGEVLRAYLKTRGA